MRIACALGTLMLLATAGCDGGGDAGPGAGSAAGALSAGRWVEQPAWVDGTDVTAIARRAGWTLVRGPVESAPPGTDVPRPVPLAVLRADGAALVPPGPAVEAILLEGAVAWVGLAGELWLDDGVQVREVDDGVLGELAVDPAGERVAYAMRAGRDAGVRVIDRRGGAPVRVTLGLQVADRPLFVDTGRLVVVGSRPGGIAGVWLARADGSAQPRPVTNQTLRTGAPLGPTFVPPPAYHDSMHVEGDVLVYDDGRAERRVPLSEVLR